MFSSTRLHLFVCIALGITVTAAPAGPSANVDARSPDVYDLSGGLLGLLVGAEAQSGSSDEDTYILKRQLAGLDIGSRLGNNMGIQHAATLGEGLGLGSTDVAQRDLYDLSGGIGALLFGGENAGNGEDEYILKRELLEVAGIDVVDVVSLLLGNNMGTQQATTPNGAITQRDLYDLSGGIGALLFGGQSSGSGEDEYILKRDVYDLSGGLLGLLIGAQAQSGNGDEDTYILKRQLAGLDIGSRLGMNMGIQHATTLGEGLGLEDADLSQRDLYDLSGGIGALIFGGESANSGEDEYILKRDSPEVEARSPDLYDLSGGVGTLLFGLSGGETGANSDEYILKRDSDEVEARSLDLYDLSGGVGALLFGLSGGETGSDSDEYILKRQL